jgi:hypothetical protein
MHDKCAIRLCANASDAHVLPPEYRVPAQRPNASTVHALCDIPWISRRPSASDANRSGATKRGSPCTRKLRTTEGRHRLHLVNPKALVDVYLPGALQPRPSKLGVLCSNVEVPVWCG